MIPSLSQLSLTMKNPKVELLLVIKYITVFYCSLDLIENDVMTEPEPEYSPLISESECSPTSLPIIVSITASIVIVVMTVLLMSLLAVYKVIQRCTKSHNNRARYCELLL